MTELSIVELIMNQSVAIAMLIYFVLRFEKLLKSNTDAIKTLELSVRGWNNGRRK